MSSYREKLLAHTRRVRAAMDVAAPVLDDATASRALALYPVLTGNGELIKAGTRVNWEGALKRATVDLWDRPDSWPDVAPVLWDDIAYHDGHRIIPDPITATKAFAMGETGWWPVDGKVYRSLMAGNTYQPGSTPTPVWEEVTT